MTGALWAQFCAVAEQEGNKAAVVDAVTGRSISYANLSAQSLAFADALSAWGHGALAFVGEPDVDALPIVLACAAAGWCFVPISDQEPSARIIDHLGHLPGPLVVASVGGLPGLLSIDPAAPLKHLGLVWQVMDCSSVPVSFRPFLVTHSSGSTGRPKAIAFSQATKLRRTWQSKTLFHVTHEDRILSPTPFHHSLGQRHFFLSVLTGATLIKAFPFSSDLWVKAVREYSVTFSVPVATHLKILQIRLKEKPEVLSSFRCIVTSSAPAEPEFKRAILDLAKFEFWEIYGMSETACATAVRYKPGEDTSHLGKQIQGTTLRIATTSPDGSGEIEVRSDCICDGYWGDEERWAKAVTSDGFFRSGDLGRLDNDGNLTFLSRTNESFESGGLVVFPAEIERVIAELPQISDCVVFGMPNSVFGNLVALAFVSNTEIASRDIIAHARAKLPKHLWPTKIFCLESFPLLASGKVDRQSLYREIRAQNQTPHLN
jgi:acyl-CoA synthetase (AMP-forming)/AMP-acid ligase II